MNVRNIQMNLTDIDNPTLYPTSLDTLKMSLWESVSFSVHQVIRDAAQDATWYSVRKPMWSVLVDIRKPIKRYYESN
jgi:hypothetical protein